jgi:hypothetical protein
MVQASPDKVSLRLYLKKHTKIKMGWRLNSSDRKLRILYSIPKIEGKKKLYMLVTPPD